MLDEIKEVEGYLRNPDADNPRVNANLLSDKFSGECKLNGLADILTLVASHYLYTFHNFSKLNKKQKKEVSKNAICIMRIWCGFENDVTDEELHKAKEKNKEWFHEYPQADGWLRAYHDKHMKEKVKDWSKYSNKWKDSLNSEYVYRAERYCYQTILVQAIARGQLKTYYLMAKTDYEDALKDDIKNANGKKPDERRQRNILKLLAAYKVLQRFHPGQKYVLLQTNRVLNWLGFDSDAADRWCLNFTWKGEFIFQKESYEKIKKFCVNPEFLKTMDIQLLDSLPDVIPAGYIVYEDTGHGQNNRLAKIKVINI